MTKQLVTMMAAAVAVTAVFLSGGCAQPGATRRGAAASKPLQVFTYTEPFGLAHAGEVLEFDLERPVEAAKCRVLDAKGAAIPYQVSVDGKRLLLRTDLAPREQATWRLESAETLKSQTLKPEAAGLVTVTADATNGWYEIHNGLCGIRIPDGGKFTDEWALLDEKEKAKALENGWEREQVKKKLGIKPTNLSPVQGLRLRDGR